MSRRRAIWTAVSVVAAVGFLAYSCIYSRRLVEGRARNASEISHSFIKKYTPPSAGDIWYSFSRHDVFLEMSFHISEADFLSWVAEHGWPVSPTSDKEPFETGWYEDHVVETIWITNGFSYRCLPPKRKGVLDWAVIVAYDRQRGKAYLSIAPVDGT